MTRVRVWTMAGWMGACLLVIVPRVAGAATNALPDFREIYDLIQTNITGVSEADLNRAAVQGLITALGPKVSLVTGNESGGPAEKTSSLNKSGVFEKDIGYLRVARVEDGVANELNAAHRQLTSTNAWKGLVLDLRYAGGNDYRAATEAADLFVSEAEPLLNWGAGLVSSHEKTNAIRIPAVVLVNGATVGASEALAAMLRKAGAGLILGSQTAGQAEVMRDFALKSGGQLRVAVGPVKLGDGTILPSHGVRPDIEVQVKPADERMYYENPFAVLGTNGLVALASTNEPNGTNLAARRLRINEAELVREHRQGTDRLLTPDAPARSRPADPPKPLVTDPVLARALDLVKGLALVRGGAR